jgi:hypothetical protein
MLSFVGILPDVQALNPKPNKPVAHNPHMVYKRPPSLRPCRENDKVVQLIRQQGHGIKSAILPQKMLACVARCNLDPTSVSSRPED